MNRLKNSLRIYWYFNRTKATMLVNGFFYYIRQIPIIGQYFPIIIYREYRIKRRLGQILLAFQLFLAVFLQLIFLFIPLLLFQFSLSGLAVWWFLLTVIYPFYRMLFFNITPKQINFIRYYQLSYVDTLQTIQLMPIGINELACLPAALIAAFIMPHSIQIFLSILLSQAAGHLLFIVLGRKSLWIKAGSLLQTLVGSGALILFCSFFIATFYWNLQGTLALSLIHPISLLLFSGIILACMLFLKHTPNSATFFLAKRSASALQYKEKEEKNQKNSPFGEALVLQKHLTITKEEPEKIHELHGNDYLNHLLFLRYRKLLNVELLKRLIFFVGAALFFLISYWFDALPSAISEQTMIALFPSLFFLMYLFTFGRKIVQISFVNCDRSMLYYPFYREKQSILSSFQARFKETLRYNTAVVLGIFCLFVELHILTHFSFSFSFFMILILLLCSLSILFSFHELFVYYLLQPFTNNLDQVHPLYRIIQYGLYLLSYLNWKLPIGSSLYVLLIFITTFIYTSVGLWVIKTYAPKTFRIKE